MMRLLKLNRLIFVTIALAVAASPLALAEDEERHIIRAYAGYLTATGDDTLNLDTIEVDNSAGYGVGYEFKISPLIGIPIDYSLFGTDVKVENAGSSSSDFDVATLGLMFHFIHARWIDLYAGPAVAYINYSDADFTLNGVRVKVETDNETTWDARLGLDFKIFPWLGVGASVEYIDASADFKVRGASSGDTSGSLDPKPVVTKLGVSFRF